MQQTCSGLSRSLEHETYRALSQRASTKGVTVDGITVASRLTGKAPSYVRDAIDTLIDGGYIERVGPGTYLTSKRCSCKPEDVLEAFSREFSNTEHLFEERKADSVLPEEVPSGAAEPTRPGFPSRTEARSTGLSRSLPSRRKNPTTVSSHLNRLTYFFVQRCGEEGISPRGWNAAALRSHLNRWFREGVSIDVLEEMVDLFAAASHDLGPRAVAWKLFVVKREELERRARRNLPPQPEMVSASIERMQKGIARLERLASATV